MSEKPKRLKRNISFSEHERDIYEYLEQQKNASAFIKRLVLNQMMIERGMVVLTTNEPSTEDKNKNVSQGTSKTGQQSQNTNEKNNEPEEQRKEMTKEELENAQLAQDLPF